MSLKITIRNQLEALKKVLGYLTFYAVFILVCYYFFNMVFPLVTALILLLDAPAVFLYIDYLVRNRKHEYEFKEQAIIKREKGVETTYRFADIDDVVLYLNPALFRGNDVPVRPHESYHFAKIIMKSVEVLYLTSLLYPYTVKYNNTVEDLIKMYMKGVPYLRKNRIFCTTLWTDNTEDKIDDNDYYGLFKEK
jgi:hypothetical protein